MDITSGLIAIAASIAIAGTGLASATAEGKAVAAALETMGRNPEMAGEIRTNMFVGVAMIESSVIYGLIIAFVLISKM